MPAVERLEPRRLLSAVTVGDVSFQMQQQSQSGGSAVEWDVLGNASSASGGLTITSVQSTAAGSVSIESADPNDPQSHDTLSFVLDPEFVGEESFTYTVSDADGNHATGTVSLTVTAGDSGAEGPLTLAEQLQQLTLQAAQAQADLAAGQAKFGGAISAAQAKLKQQQTTDEKKHADALAAAQKKLDEKVNAGHDKAVDAIKAADTAYQQALTERLDAAAAAIATGQDTLVSKSTEADQLYQQQHQDAVDAATSALDSAAATLVAAHDTAQAAAASQMAATETGWTTAVTGASADFETTYQATEAALTAAADEAVTLFGTATDGVASSFSTALTAAVTQRDALLAGLSGTTYVTTFSDPAYATALMAADTALSGAIAAARANLQGQSTTAMNGYNAATQTAANDLTTGEQNATTQLGTDLHNADVAEQTAVTNAQTDYDATAALAQTAYDDSIHGAHDDLVAAVTEDEAALEETVNLAETKFETAAKEALAKYTEWVAEAFGAPVGSTPTTGTTTTTTTTTGGVMPGAMPAASTGGSMSTSMGTSMGSSMGGSTGGYMTGTATGTTVATLGTFQIAVKADAQTAYEALQLAANVERDACVAADTAYITAITADQTAYLAVYGGLQQSLQTAVNMANTQVNSARDAALATYHQHQQQIASTYNSSTTSPMTMEDYMAQSAARQAAEAGAKREFLSTVASAELTAAQSVGHQYVSAVRSERGARATLMVALRHDENVWTETKAAAETSLKDQTDIALGRFMDDVTTLEGAYDTAAEQKFTTFESKVALAEQTAIVADQTAEAAFENALVADEELEIHADAAAEAAFEHALEDDAQAAEKAIALADQAWFNAEGDAESDWLHAETDVSAAYVAALDAAAQGLDTELSADETAQVTAINAALTAWQTEVDNAWSAAFLNANGSTTDSTAAADAFLGFGDSVNSSVVGVMTGFNAAYHALTSALVADVTAADQTEAAAAQSQTTTIANATKNALHQIGQSLKDEETAEADAEHAATTTVSDAIQGFITGETDAADAQTHTMIGAVTGYTNGLVTTAFGALIGDWADQATRFGAVTGASVGFATSTIDASGNYETATHAADLAALIATHRREETQLKSILKSATALATAGASARVAQALKDMTDNLQRLLALDDNQLSQYSPDQMWSVLGGLMMIPTDFTSPTAPENLTAANDATPDQLTATDSARTIIDNAANTAQGLRQSGVQTAALQMMMGNATAYAQAVFRTMENEAMQLAGSADNQFAKMKAKDQAAAIQAAAGSADTTLVGITAAATSPTGAWSNGEGNSTRNNEAPQNAPPANGQQQAPPAGAQNGVPTPAEGNQQNAPPAGGGIQTPFVGGDRVLPMFNEIVGYGFSWNHTYVYTDRSTGRLVEPCIVCHGRNGSGRLPGLTPTDSYVGGQWSHSGSNACIIRTYGAGFASGLLTAPANLANLGKAIVDHTVNPGEESDDFFDTEQMRESIGDFSYSDRPRGSLLTGAGETTGDLVGGYLTGAAVLKVGSLTCRVTASEWVRLQQLADQSLIAAGGGARVGPMTQNGRMLSVFHKGELLNGQVGSHRYLSTGTNKASVDALHRAGTTHQFDIPEDVLFKWELENRVFTIRGLDLATGIVNEEIRFNASLATELNRYKK